MNEILFSIGLVLVIIVATGTFVLFGLAGGFSNFLKQKRNQIKIEEHGNEKYF